MSRTEQFDSARQRAQATIMAKAEVGKLGNKYSTSLFDNPQALSDSERLKNRAELRRASNDIRDACRQANTEGNAGRERELLEALDGIHNAINAISNQIDIDAGAEAAFTGRGGTKDSGLFDQEGKRIGTLLSASDLNNSASIAKKLGVVGSHNEDMSLTEFVRGIAGMRTTDAVRNALQEGTNSAGGYTVPTILIPGIYEALVPASALLSAGANIANIDAQAASFKLAAVATVPTPAWREESGALAVSEPTFRGIEIVPRSLAFLFKISRELLMDGQGIEVALRRVIAQAFAKELDRAGLLGDGVAPEIAGLANIDGVNTFSMGANGAALTSYAPFIRAAGLIKSSNAPAPTAAIMSVREDETIALFTDTTDQPLRRPESLTSWKFLATSQLPTNGTQGTGTNAAQMFVGDFRNFTYFIRERVSIQLLRELYAETGEVGFACHARVDVAAAYPSAFTVINGVIPEA